MEKYIVKLTAECTDPTTKLQQQAIAVKTKYYSDLATLQKNAEGEDFLEEGEAKLLSDANLQISMINNQIDQITSTCNENYGS